MDYKTKCRELSLSYKSNYILFKGINCPVILQSLKLGNLIIASFSIYIRHGLNCVAFAFISVCNSYECKNILCVFSTFTPIVSNKSYEIAF